MAVDAQGLAIETVEDILTSIETQEKANINAAIVVTPEEPLGQINGIFADALRQAWEALAIAYNGFNPDAAEGFLLDALCALTGTIRLKATYTRVNVTCNLDPGVVIRSGVHFAHVENFPSIRFTPVEDFTNEELSTDDFVVEFRAESLGPTALNFETLNQIATPITGWNYCVNDNNEAIIGRNEETDAELRTRREERLQAQGSGTTGAIASAVLDVDGVISVTVFENVGDVTDVDGLPPHSFEVLVYDGESPAADNEEIAQEIHNNRPAGIPSYGSDSANAVDEFTGETVVEKFSRPTTLEVYIDITVTPEVEDLALKEFIVAEMQEHNVPGADVIRNRIICAALDFPGVEDVTLCELGFTASPTGTVNLTVGSRQMAAFSVSRITVV